MIIIKNLLLLFILISSVNSFSQTIEGMKLTEFTEMIDSLKQNENYLEAFDAYYEFVKSNNSIYSRNKQLSVISEDLQLLTVTKVSKEEKVIYYRNKTDLLIEKGLYKKAIYALMPLQYIDSTLHVGKEIYNLIFKLPTDTVKNYDGRTLQLFSKQSVNTNGSREVVYYLLSDSSLFSGVLIRRVKTDCQLVSLNYENYTDGKLSSRRVETYQPTNIYNKNMVYEYQDSSRFFLFTSTAMVNDTNKFIQYNYNGTISYEKQAYLKGEYSCELYISFDKKGDTTSFRETLYCRNYTDGTTNSVTLNQYNDTIGINREYYLNDDFIEYYLLLDENSDTISLLQVKNGIADGLYIEQVEDDTDSTFFKRILIDNGLVVDIQVENAIFLNEKNNVISKTQFIELLNKYDYPYLDYEFTMISSYDFEKSGYDFLVGFNWVTDKKLKKIFKQRRKLDKKYNKN